MKSTTTTTKPWLDADGNHLPDATISELGKTWSQKTWDEYLKPIEEGVSGLQLRNRKFDKLCENMQFSIFEQSSSSSSEEVKEKIQQAMSTLSPTQRLITEKIFFEGRSELDVAAELGRSRNTIKVQKKRALKQLKIELAEVSPILTSMKGQEKSAQLEGPFEDEELNEVFWSEVNRF